MVFWVDTLFSKYMFTSIEQKSKYFVDDERQVSHCQKKKLVIKKELEWTLCGVGLELEL